MTAREDSKKTSLTKISLYFAAVRFEGRARLCGFARRRHLGSGVGRGARGRVGCQRAGSDLLMLIVMEPEDEGCRVYSVTIDITGHAVLIIDEEGECRLK